MIKKYALWAALLIAVIALTLPKVLPHAESSSSNSKEQNSSQKNAANGKSGGEGRSALRVSTVVIAKEPFAEVLNSTGSLRAEESVELQAEINGKVVAINFTEGAQVKA